MVKSDEEIKKVLSAKAKDELVGISRRLGLVRYHRSTKDELIVKIIRENDRKKLEYILFGKKHRKTKGLLPSAIITFIIAFAFFCADNIIEADKYYQQRLDFHELIGAEHQPKLTPIPKASRLFLLNAPKR